MNFKKQLLQLQNQGAYRSLKILPQGTFNFCSNDYLALSHHSKVIEGALQATKKYGAGSGAARLISGNNDLMERLEYELSQWKQVESSLLFNSGYHANIGVIPALADENTIIFSDEFNHASIIDGCRLSKAKTVIYRHNDMGHLEELLKNPPQPPFVKGGDSHFVPPLKKGVRGILIITESVFSMEGDLAPLEDLKELAEKYDALLYVDEAHAVGMFGENGVGRLGKNPSENILTMGTFGKAFGSYGAFVCGSDILKKYLINKARSFIFSTSLPPSAMGASRAALKIIQGREGENLREELWSNVSVVNKELGLDQGESPIFSIKIGDAKKTMALSERLLKDKIYIQGIRPPTVPEGSSRLRLTVSARHTVKELFCLIKNLEKIL